MKTVTMKFGGTSVGSPEAIRNVLYITRRDLDQGNRVVLVVSAMSGVTDTLLSAIEMAITGDKWGYLSVAEKLRDRHQEAINRLMAYSEERQKVTQYCNKLVDEFVELCQAINILGEATPRIRDAITAFGERLSSRLVAAALREGNRRKPVRDYRQQLSERHPAVGHYAAQHSGTAAAPAGKRGYASGHRLYRCDPGRLIYDIRARWQRLQRGDLRGVHAE
jgi:aspartate kinase